MVKNLLILFCGLFLGAILISTPDIVGLYSDHVISKYQKEFCKDKGIGPDQCHFSTYYDPYAKENPTLVSMDYYFQLGNGPLYYILSKRCTNRPMHNPSALGDKSGTITLREYFYTQCSKFNNDVSDLLWGEE